MVRVRTTPPSQRPTPTKPSLAIRPNRGPMTVVFVLGVVAGISGLSLLMSSGLAPERLSTHMHASGSPAASSNASHLSLDRRLPVSMNEVDASNSRGRPVAPPTSKGEPNGTRPAWCDELIANPRGSPMSKPCSRGPLNDLCYDGKPSFFGQLNHDAYLYMHHFRHLNRAGVYLDLAANHAKLISNTYFLDRCANWSGLCVEANARYFHELKHYRSCQLLTKCVSDRDETVTFMMYEGLSGISETNKNMPEFAGHLRHSVTSRKMSCVVLRKPLRETGMTIIDYLSLDLEGHELKALHGIDWKATRIAVISLEAPQNSSVSHFLLEKGYTRHEPLRPPQVLESIAVTGDEIYLAPGVIFGRPE
jgi:FkbM family methyltransferase